MPYESFAARMYNCGVLVMKMCKCIHELSEDFRMGIEKNGKLWRCLAAIIYNYGDPVMDFRMANGNGEE